MKLKQNKKSNKQSSSNQSYGPPTWGEPGACGYLYVDVKDRKTGEIIGMPVHQLVGETWLPPPNNGWTFIRHINGIITDNRAVNLEYISDEDAMVWIRQNLTNPFL